MTATYFHGDPQPTGVPSEKPAPWQRDCAATCVGRDDCTVATTCRAERDFKRQAADRRIERLEDWKASAMFQLGEWQRLANEVAERNGLTPDQLGQSWVSMMRSHLDWLNVQNDQLSDDAARLLTRCEALAIDAAWRADWMTRAVNLLTALRDDLEHELTVTNHLEAVDQLLADEFEDGDDPS